ncbi:MAG: hypothetical protein ACT4OO_04355 [Nitrospiraceae bacterium]
MSTRLTPDHPCQVVIAELGHDAYDLVVVAYDYFSEFATICGLLSAFGLDIQEGRIYTFADAISVPSDSAGGRQGTVRPRSRGRSGSTRKKIVDVFRVHPIPGVTFSSLEQHQLVDGLDRLIRLLDSQQHQEARHQVNRLLVERLGRQRRTFAGLLQPVQITFNNGQSPIDTIMDIRSDDTPAFLYSFANALAMRNVYISKAEVRNVGAKVHDRFHVRNRDGHKLVDPLEQQTLRTTAVLIKQFTHALTWAPDPAKAIASFDQFLDLLVEDRRKPNAAAGLDFVTKKSALPLLAKLLGASDFLWEDFLRRQHANLLPMLAQYRTAPLIKPKKDLLRALDRRLTSCKTDEQRQQGLNDFKDQELFRIDMKHLLDQHSGLPDFSLALTELAEIIMSRSVRDCQDKLARTYGRPFLANRKSCPFTILGAGKFGGRELGYASDIEVLFVYGGAGRTRGRHSLENSEYFERLAQELLQWIEAKQEGIFHLDVRLRPHGGKGSLANPLDEIRTYYSPAGLAAPFERQALIKLRHVAGDDKLGSDVESHRDHYVYSGQPWDVSTALDLRRQQIKELVGPGQLNVKYSPGGLIDVEYAVQYLQLTHGHEHPVLRTPNTMEALGALVQTGIVSHAMGEDLQHAYLFFRKLIDGLRMVRGHAKDLVLPDADSDDFVFLARRVGYTTEDWQAGAGHLESDIVRHRENTRRIFEQRFGKI